MLKRITFGNYKAFVEKTTIELRPITVLLGKNSSGKSSICKLVSILSTALSDNAKGLLPLRNNDVVLGSRYEDLFHGGILNNLAIQADFDNDVSLAAEYLMDDGEFLLRRYSIKGGGLSKEVEYHRKEDSKKDEFVGLIRNKLFHAMGLTPNVVAFSVDYIGPLRKAAQRAVFSTDIMETGKVGYRGEFTPYLLLDSYLQNGSLLTDVSNWYDENMDGQRLDVLENGSLSGSFSIIVRRGNSTVNLADVGEGNNQLLPIITQSFAGSADLTIIEQPALHLHPGAHACVAYRIAHSVKDAGRKYLIESHSENFVLGLRKLVAEGYLLPTDVAVYFIDHNGESAYAQLIEIEDDGELTNWPEGNFEEDFELLKEIKRGRR